MNKERLLAILDHIKKHPECHDQTRWESFCGTKRCIGGHSIVMFSDLCGPGLLNLNWEIFNFWKEACDLLDLSAMEANYLFDIDRTIEEIEEYILFGEGSLLLRRSR